MPSTDEVRSMALAKRSTSPWRRTLLPCVLVFLCVLLYAPYKVPNFGWVDVYQAPNLPPLTTGLPVFRPWLAVEHLELSLTGQTRLSTNVSYGVVAFIALYLIWRAGKTTNAYLTWYVVLVSGVVIWFAGRSGTFADIFFSTTLLVILSFVTSKQTESKWRTAAFLGVVVAFMDLSRPYGWIFAAISLGACSYRYRRKAWIIAVVSACLAVPFHVIQVVKFSNPILSTYGGQNLSEVFTSQRDCLAEFGISDIDTRAFSDCSSDVSGQILGGLLADPGLILQAATPERLLKMALPEPFWYATGLDPTSWPPGVSVVVRLATFSLLVLAGLSLGRNLRSLLGVTFVGLGLMIALVSHGGAEAIRVMLPFLLTTSFLAVHARLPDRVRRRCGLSSETGATRS